VISKLKYHSPVALRPLTATSTIMLLCQSMRVTTEQMT